MRPRLSAILFFVVLFASLAGIGVAQNNLSLGLIPAFAFLIAILGLAFTGLVYLIHSIQLGRQRAYGTPTVTRLGEVVRSDSERRIADYFTSSGVR